jgi:hypothetical protein
VARAVLEQREPAAPARTGDVLGQRAPGQPSNLPVCRLLNQQSTQVPGSCRGRCHAGRYPLAGSGVWRPLAITHCAHIVSLTRQPTQPTYRFTKPARPPMCLAPALQPHLTAGVRAVAIFRLLSM